MKTAIILHGMARREVYYDPSYDSQGSSHWLPWLQRQLQVRDYLAQTPEMPRPYAPEFAAWRDIFERHGPDKETLLVGYSCGAGFLVRWLSENKEVQVGHVVLVAPWLDLERAHGDLFDFIIDPEIVNRCARMSIVHSDNDHLPMQRTVQLLQSTLGNADYHEFHNYGHFCLKHIGGREFPELLDICLK